jgi:hypothetical protein
MRAPTNKRVDDMSVNGLLGSLPFPTIVAFDGYVFHDFKNKR